MTRTFYKHYFSVSTNSNGRSHIFSVICLFYRILFSAKWSGNKRLESTYNCRFSILGKYPLEFKFRTIHSRIFLFSLLFF